ncbi:hypothetical protein AMECASPLE_019096 [Ameca splendens]|uniref:Uncharacterized protein n=1 Tax=Ameca splendens TaxID=208324 RepID=A0ABV0XRW4_9TELE
MVGVTGRVCFTGVPNLSAISWVLYGTGTWKEASACCLNQHDEHLNPSPVDPAVSLHSTPTSSPVAQDPTCGNTCLSLTCLSTLQQRLPKHSGATQETHSGY